MFDCVGQAKYLSWQYHIHTRGYNWLAMASNLSQSNVLLVQLTLTRMCQGAQEDSLTQTLRLASNTIASTAITGTSHDIITGPSIKLKEAGTPPKEGLMYYERTAISVQ
jgi:hypothetical protein